MRPGVIGKYLRNLGLIAGGWLLSAALYSLPCMATEHHGEEHYKTKPVVQKIENIRKDVIERNGVRVVLDEEHAGLLKEFSIEVGDTMHRLNFINPNKEWDGGRSVQLQLYGFLPYYYKEEIGRLVPCDSPTEGGDMYGNGNPVEIKDVRYPDGRIVPNAREVEFRPMDWFRNNVHSRFKIKRAYVLGDGLYAIYLLENLWERDTIVHTQELPALYLQKDENGFYPKYIVYCKGNPWTDEPFEVRELTDDFPQWFKGYNSISLPEKWFAVLDEKGRGVALFGIYMPKSDDPKRGVYCLFRPPEDIIDALYASLRSNLKIRGRSKQTMAFILYPVEENGNDIYEVREKIKEEREFWERIFRNFRGNQLYGAIKQLTIYRTNKLKPEK